MEWGEMIRSYFQSQTDFAAYHPVSFFEYVCLFRGKAYSIYILRKSRPLAVRALYVSLHNNHKRGWFTGFAVRYLLLIHLACYGYPSLTLQNLLRLNYIGVFTHIKFRMKA